MTRHLLRGRVGERSVGAIGDELRIPMVTYLAYRVLLAERRHACGKTPLRGRHAAHEAVDLWAIATREMRAGVQS